MADKLTPEARSVLMARVKNKDTKPETIVRQTAHGLGFRFRLHGKDLPGRPDLVFRGRRKVIFVHGCFWHRHDCARATVPSTNVAFWVDKFAKNVARDRSVLDALHQMRWSTLIIWECETRNREELAQRLTGFLQTSAQ